MNKNLLIFLVALTAFAEAQTQRQGDLLGLIEDIRLAMPGRDSYGYVEPTASQLDTFRTVTLLVLQQRFHEADSVAQLLDYRLYEWTDTHDANGIYYVLMEPQADQSGGVKWGWGTYVFNFNGTCEVMIESPHPYFDTNTWMVAYSAYRLLNAEYFLMAGTHRYANGDDPAPADVAHNSDNIFHLVHTILMPLSEHALQVHGYSRNKPQYEGYPDIILSNGTSNPSEILNSLASNFIQDGYSTGIYNGSDYIYLGATTNHQGQWCNSRGYSFIHMELEYYIRTSQFHWQKIINDLYKTFVIPVQIGRIVLTPGGQHLQLQQNYPNPFNSITVIPFTLNSPTNVEIQIYNMLGQQIWHWQCNNMPAGSHQIEFPAADHGSIHLSSGVYFYQLKTAHDTMTGRMIYLP